MVRRDAKVVLHVGSSLWLLATLPIPQALKTANTDHDVPSTGLGVLNGPCRGANPLASEYRNTVGGNLSLFLVQIQESDTKGGTLQKV